MEIAGNTELSKYSNHREKDPSKYQDAWSKIQTGKIESEKIEQDCPIVSFMSGNTEPKIVKKEINKAYTKAIKSNHKIREMLLEGTFPIWELTPIVNSVLETVTDEKEKEQIVAVLSKMETKEKVKDILLTLVPIGLSILCFFIPGGANLLLLGVRAGLQTANAVVGVVSAINDIQDARLEYHKSWSDLKLTDEQIDLIDSMDVNDSTFQYLTACVSAGFVVFDVMDAVKASNLIGKCNALDDVTRSALKQSKRYGEKAFQNCDLPSLNKIGKELPQPHATEIFNMKNTTEVVDTLYRSSKPKVMQNLASLEAKQVPVALDFFPNNLNTNVIWLGMDFDGKAGDVLTSSKKAIEQYNKTITSVDLMIHITDTEQTVVDKANKLFKSTASLTEAERVALLREMNIGNKNIKSSNVFIRLNQNFYPDLTYNKKEFAWVTDPYVLMGKGEMKELMEGIGYSYEDAKNAKKLYMDVIIFDKPENVQKLIEPQIIDWDKIKDITFDKLSKEYDDILKMPDRLRKASIDDFIKKYPNLVSNNKVDKALLEQNYIKFYREKMPGVKLENETRFENMTDFFNNQIGANQYFTGSGVTVSDKAGIGSTEFAFINNDCKFNVEQINKKYPETCHIVRLETDDTGMFILKK